MKSLAEEMAERFYEIHESIILLRITYSKTSLVSKLWKDLPERQRLEYIDSFRQTLADPKLVALMKAHLEL